MNSVLFKMACKIYSDANTGAATMGSKSMEHEPFQAKKRL